MFGRSDGSSLPEAFSHSHKAWDAYMAKVWEGIFALLKWPQDGIIIEVGCGNSVKIGAALARLSFTGTVWLVDPFEEGLRAAEKLYRDMLPVAQIRILQATLADAASQLPTKPDCLVSNHAIDDMIMAAAGDELQLKELFGWTAIKHEETIPLTNQVWSRLAADTRRLEAIKDAVFEEWRQAITVLQPRQCMLSQYPSATLEHAGMGALNQHAGEVFARLRQHFAASEMTQEGIQNALDANENFGDVHIGGQVLNAQNWLVTSSGQSKLFRQSGNLYRNPELFDLVVNAPEHELDFYLGQAKRLGTDILELACGTGRVVLSLIAADKQLRCEGLDLSEEMLALARVKARNQQADTAFHHGDMSHFSLGKKYDMIFVPLSSLLYLQTDEQLKGCFNSVRAHLKPQGEFMFVAFNPSEKILSLPPHERYAIKQFINPENGREVLVEQSSHYDAEKRVNFAMHYYSCEGEKDFFHHPVHLRILYPRDIEELVQNCGFSLTARYGDYERRPFTPDSQFQVICCKSVAQAN